jgi:hypothetical protein
LQGEPELVRLLVDQELGVAKLGFKTYVRERETCVREQRFEIGQP